jgi:hypothetical protein
MTGHDIPRAKFLEKLYAVRDTPAVELQCEFMNAQEVINLCTEPKGK